MADVIAEQGAAIDGVANPDATVSNLAGAGHLKNAIARAIADGTANATASRLGAQGRIYAIAGGGYISPGLPGGSVWSPSALFASSEVGVWYDPSDLSTMWTDDGTTQAGVNDLVYRIDDKSGNGFHAKQTTEASRPILRESGGLYYLEFDGTDDFLETLAIDLTGGVNASVFAGIYKASDAAQAGICGHGLTGSQVGAFYLTAPRDSTYEFGIAYRVTAGGNDGYIDSAGFAAPFTSVNTGLVDFSAASSAATVKLRVNSVQQTLTFATERSGAPSLLNTALTIGMANGGSPFNGRIYSLIVRNVTSDATEIDNAEAYVAGKTGVTL